MAKQTPSRALTRVHSKQSDTDWRRRFLDQLAATSDVTSAAQTVGVTEEEVYRMLASEPEFAEGWQAALAEGYHHLEMELLRRFRSGDMNSQDNTKFDFANSIRLLISHRDQSAKRQTQGREVSAAEVRSSIDQKLEDIRARLEQRQRSEGSWS